MPNLESNYVDTRTKRFNPGLIRDYGFAISSGQTAISSTATAENAPLTFVSKHVLEDMINWLRIDVEHHSHLMASVVLAMSSFDPENLDANAVSSLQILSHIGSSFAEDAQTLSSRIASGFSLMPSAELVALAKRVADIGGDNSPTDEWAQRLSRDVANEND